MSREPIKVLFIGGWGRSGTTLLANILGEVDGFFHVGEVRTLWDSILEDTKCGCGQLVSQCDTWRQILHDMGDDDVESAQKNIEMRESVDRTRFLPLLLSPRMQRVLGERLIRFRVMLARLYTSISEVTGSRVIVDSSKIPSYALLLSDIPGIEVYVVHMIRDPRGTAYSWRKIVLSPDKQTPQMMVQYNPFHSSIMWCIWNYVFEGVWKGSKRYYRLLYEDFVSFPEKSVSSILDMLGEDVPLLPVQGAETTLGENHTVSGNPSRFKRGTIMLKLDDAWRSSILPRDRWLTNALTWPLLFKYGYYKRYRQS